jgi:hypothetical protein
MDEEKFNLTVRRFLKTFGVTAQREIEKVVDAGMRSGRLRGSETLRARAILEIDGLDFATTIEGDIELE